MRPAIPIVHADLFRIKEASELAELGWDEAADGALVLVEWPERAGDGSGRSIGSTSPFTSTSTGAPTFRTVVRSPASVPSRPA